MNVCEWIQKMTAYLKNKDFWISIETVLKKQQEQKSDKILKSVNKITKIIRISKKADDSTIDYYSCDHIETSL